MNKDIHPIFDRLIGREERENFLNQKAKVFWLTGLSGSGKSTIAQGVERQLFDQGYFGQVLDGDNIRTGISNNLNFSAEDRSENIRRIAEVAKLYLNSGVVVLCSFISPTVEIRDHARSIIGEDDFELVFVSASLEECEKRDVKGLYKKARKGEIREFTGIDSPYEIPEDASLVINTAEEPVEESIRKLTAFIVQKSQKK